MSIHERLETLELTDPTERAARAWLVETAARLEGAERERYRAVSDAAAFLEDYVDPWLDRLATAMGGLEAALARELPRYDPAAGAVWAWAVEQRQASPELVALLERVRTTPGLATLVEALRSATSADAARDAVARARALPEVWKAALHRLAEVTESDAPGSAARNGGFAGFLQALDALGSDRARRIRAILLDTEAGKSALSEPLEVTAMLLLLEQDGFLSDRGNRAWVMQCHGLYKRNMDPLEAHSILESGRPSRLLSSVGRMTPVSLAIGMIILATIGAFAFVIAKSPSVLELKNVDASRGFITFVFTLGTISLFLVITAATVFDARSTGDAKYDRAKTILSMLIGIFGTVLGYYFGIADKDADAAPGLQMSPIVITHGSEPETGRINFAAAVSGGTAPYAFYVTAKDSAGAPIGDTVIVASATGELSRSARFEAQADANETVSLVVHALDAERNGSAVVSRHIALGEPPPATVPTEAGPIAASD